MIDFYSLFMQLHSYIKGVKNGDATTYDFDGTAKLPSGILFYARSNVAYLFGNRWIYQTLYKIFALIMLFVGGLQAYTVVWDLGDVGVGLMTVFNLIVLFPLSGEALRALKEYEEKKTNK